MDQTVQIFLCHAHQDKKQVKTIYQRLSAAGFKPWMDTFDLVGGEPWQPAIEKAIRNSNFFLACLSKETINKRGFVQREIKAALDIWLEMLPGDIYIIPLRLEECDVPESLSRYQWVDYFDNDGWDRLVKGLYKGMERFGMVMPVKLRTKPVLNLNEQQVEIKIKEIGLTDLLKNRLSKGLQHQFEKIERHGEYLVIDHTTKLIWQQSGSNSQLTFHDAQKYIQTLNDTYFAQHNQWRLPTLEEAMSLMEYEPKNDKLYIDPIFERRQGWIWTADKESVEKVWTVDFDYGFCGYYPIKNRNFVRAVLL